MDWLINWLERRLTRKKHEVVKLAWKKAELEKIKREHH